MPHSTRLICCLLAFIEIGSVTSAVSQTARIVVQVDKPGIRVSPLLYGIFFEEINRAGDGGLYAEMIQNRSLEDAGVPIGWHLVAGAGAEATMVLDKSMALNPANPTSLRLDIVKTNGGRVGVANDGFKGAPYPRDRDNGKWVEGFEKAFESATSGLAVVQGRQYRFSCYARSAMGFSSPLTVSIEKQDGTVITVERIEAVGPKWTKHERLLTAHATDANARLVVATTAAGTVWLDMVSLFPKDTFQNRPNGVRADLAEMIRKMKPAFVRFPGGCFVEGSELTDAARWKKTIGDVAERPGHWNLWGYYSEDGLGYHEYLQFCEDIQAEPLFVINCGMSHKEQHAKELVQVPNLAEYVQDALDAIEYANGPADGKWGSLRAKAGHPASFNLRYLEIGNENGGPTYQEHYRQFYDAIKARYPAMHLVANELTTLRPTEINDEHYYNSPEFFLRQADKYDKYDRSKHKVYVGEYAVTQGAGEGNLKAAVGEAAFMTGMERNSDVVLMTSYAPLFVHPAWKRWNPNAIVFDSSRVYGTPSYHVQAMFGQNRGDVNLPVELTCPSIEDQSLRRGMVGVGTWRTQAEFKDIRVTRDGQTLFASDFTKPLKGWRTQKGKWEVKDGMLRQMGTDEDVRAFVGDANWGNYTLSLKARKLGGTEGFLVIVGALNDRGKSWWNIGGWGNKHHGLEMRNVDGTRVPGSIETGRWYDIRVELQGARIRCYLDDKLVQESGSAKMKALYAVAGRVDATNDILLKVVNAAEFPLDAQVGLTGVTEVSRSAQGLVLTSTSGDDENTFAEPLKISPQIMTIDNAAATFRHTFPAHSVSVLRIHAH